MSNEIDYKYLRLFSNFFNRSCLFDLINKRENVIKRTIMQSKNNTNLFSNDCIITYEDLYNYLYGVMNDYYKCEYVYLNNIFINEILKNHDENHAILTELCVKDSQADLVIVNGTTTVYEIKTELDTLARLPKQLDDYTSVFDKIYVITNKKYLKQVRLLIDQKHKGVGICLLNQDGTLTKIRESKSHIARLDKSAMFDVLNRKEFELINDDYYIAKKYFIKMSHKKAHEFYKNALFNRAKDIDYISNYPDSLKLAVYKIQNKLNKNEKKLLQIKLKQKIWEE